MAPPAPKRGSRGPWGRIAAFVAVLCAKVLATAIAIAVPVLGVWAGSSLAAFHNGPVWVAIAAGVLLFPVAPLAWDAWAEWRRRRKGDERPRILTFWDRMVVRTFALNFVFLAGFLALAPKAIFTALSTRGDWMLEGLPDGSGAGARAAVLDFADHLSWLYEAAHDNPYEDVADGADPLPTPAPNEGLSRSAEPARDTGAGAGTGTGTSPSAGGDAVADTASGAATEPGGVPASSRAWPFPKTLHPLVRDVPGEHEATPEALARYVAEREPDPFLRVKALHDWVADRIAYDAPAYTAGTYPPQDAETVFRTRTAVCAGYARLMVELGRAIDEEIVYVVGDARVRDSVSGEPHAWNAVRIDGDWYLMDVTWDAGHLDGSGRFVKRYETTSFLTPPEVFGLDHLPDEPEWQLRAQPLGRGEFNRQPMLRAAFFAVGLRLIEPARSQIDVDGRVKLVIDNPRGRFLLGKFRSRGGSGADGACGVRNGRRAEILCAFPRPGAWEVSLYDGPVMYGTYTGVGSIDVNSR